MRVKKESERASLRLNIKKTKIMASSRITEWQIEGENLEVVADFLFLGSKIMMDRDFSLEIKKKQFLLGRKVVTNLDSMLKSRFITLPTKVHYSQGYSLPSVTYSCES